MNISYVSNAVYVSICSTESVRLFNTVSFIEASKILKKLNFVIDIEMSMQKQTKYFNQKN